MDPSQDLEKAQRNLLWANWRLLRREIDQLAAGAWEDSQREQQLVMVLAQVVISELDWQAQDAEAG